jgi:hypothetical protein
MFMVFLIGVSLYGSIGLLFLVTSSAELLESGRSTSARLASTILTSLFWPLTVLILSLTVAYTRPNEAFMRLDNQAAF